MDPGEPAPHLEPLRRIRRNPGYYRGVGWYAYGFIPNGQWKDRRVILHFEGANQVAEVFVNGTPVGSHTGGYTAFNFDITRHLEFGKKNIIKVRLDNKHDRDIPPLNADFTFYGGIYRNVKLIAVDPVHFDLQNCASEGVFVETPSVDSAVRRSYSAAMWSTAATHPGRSGSKPCSGTDREPSWARPSRR